MPRTTLDLDRTVLEELRRRASAEGKSMGQVASEVLGAGLHEEAPHELPPLEWARRPMGPFKIDLEDKEALWRLLDKEELERGSG
jgi:plasmid stability protein